MNEDLKKIIGILLAVALFVAAQYGIVVPAIQNAIEIGMQRGNSGGMGVMATSLWSADRSGTTLTGASGAYMLFNSGSTLNVKSGASALMQTLTVTGTATTGAVSSTYMTSTNVISMGGATFSGAIKYGTAATYASGASITHGFATTPTVCFINPTQNITATYTITTTGFSSDMQTTASPIYWMCGK